MNEMERRNLRIVSSLWAVPKHRRRMRKIRNALARRGRLKPMSTLAWIYR